MEGKIAASNNQPAKAVFLLSLCIIFTNQADAKLLDPTLIGRELQRFARDALGVDEMQNYFDGFQYHKSTIKGEEITPHLAVKLSDKFKARFEVTKRLKKAVEDSYARSEKAAPETECCHVNKSTLKYSERFRCKVDLDNVCMKISGSASSNPVYLDDRVFQEMKDILETYPFIKWQYFGSEEGVMTIYPLFDDHEECGKFDPRYRPYYVETATPEAKDVVLVIDISASMSGEKLSIAKEAAKTVLDTMNPRDQVGVVSFNNHASTPGDVGSKSRCYSERLALAVPANIRCMKNYVDGLVPYGQTQYRIGFEKAFSLLKGSVSKESGEKKKRVILFLTDGAPSDEKTELIFETIRDRNFELNNSVIILTYGFGNADQAILEDIAKQNTAKYGVPANTSVGDIPPGRYTFLKDIKTLRSVMATYYNLFALGKQLNPVVSVPYIDAFGTGLMITITLPCFHKGNFIGVVGTDIHVEDLLSDVTFFNQGQSTYAFVVSNSGRTLIHPLLPIPTDAYGDPFFIDIRTLETETEFTDVFDSIKNGKSGSKTFVAKRFLPRGEKETDGVTVMERNCTYFWAPLAEIDFSVGVVVPVSHAKDQLNSLSIPPDFTFKYYRIDLINPENPCSHFGTYAVKDTTVVKLAPGAYLDPFEFLGKKETKADVDLLTAYMKDKTGTVTNPGLKSDIRDTVIATWKVEDLWLHDKTELTQYLVWRYIGTSNGVFRLTPGSVEDKGYDPRQRPWYRKALAHTGLLALTSPYMDSGGAGVVITAGRALYRGEPSHMHHTNDEVLGVVGADFPLTYFHRLLTKVYPMCEWTKSYSCFVMDSAGFLIMHEDFLLSSTTALDAEYVHVTEKEKYIAEDLIRKRYLIKRECRDLEEIRKKSFYEVHLPPGGVDTLRSGVRCTKYQMAQIIGTNAYIGVAVRELLCSAEPCSCSLDSKCSFFNLTCECPCTSSMDFRYCLSQFPDSSIPIFPPSAHETEAKTDHHSSHVPEMKCKDLDPTPGLQKCFDPRCSERNSSQTCGGVVGCYWCKNDKDNVPLKQPYCASSEVCFRGKEAEQIKCPMGSPHTMLHPQKDKTTNDKVNTVQEDSSHGTSTGTLAGIAFGCTALLAVIVIITFLVSKYFRQHPTNIDADPPDAGPRPPEPPPVFDNGGFDEHYDEPVEPQHQASVAPTALAQPYDNEMRVRSDEKPPNLPPPRKESPATACAIPPTKRLSSSIFEEKGECSGPQLLPECQNSGASDLRQPDIPEKKGKSSYVLPASPRRHPEDSANATSRVKKSVAISPSLPLFELRGPFSASTSQPATGESQQFGSYSPVQLHRERSNSVVLDIHGYVKCIP